MSKRKNRKKKQQRPEPAAGSRGADPKQATRPDTRKLLDQLMLAGDSGKREIWVYLAWMVFAAFGGIIFYLGSRPGGMTPVVLYMQGRVYVALAGFLVLVFGCIRSTLKRPFFQAGRLRAMIALAIVVGVANYPFPYPSSHEGRPSQVAFELPVRGEWTVFWGGEGTDENRLAGFYPDRRWGLHLVIARDGSTHLGAGESVEDYYAWNQPVLAPAAGEVVAVHDGEPTVALARLARGGEAHGNHVVLKVAEDEYCFVTHLQAGSMPVVVGDRVEAGDELGRVGYSGRMPLTPQPHVALFLQDTPLPELGEAIPWRFHGYLADGRAVSAGLPTGGVAGDGALLGQRVIASSDS